MAKTRRPKSPPEERQQLSDAGDILGLLDHFAELQPPLGSPGAFHQLAKALRRKAKEDLSSVTEDAFAIIISRGVELLMRVEYYVTHRLREHEEVRNHVNLPIPDDLIAGGWIERAERLSRFVGEMAALRAQVRHRNQTSDEHERRSRQSQRPRLVGGLDPHPRQARGRQASSASRWRRRASA